LLFNSADCEGAPLVEGPFAKLCVYLALDLAEDLHLLFLLDELGSGSQ